MLKKAITDITALKLGSPPKYNYGLKLEEKTLTWLSSLNIQAFPLAILHINGRKISSLSYYLGILLDIPAIHSDVVSILTNWDKKQRYNIQTISLALDVNDRLLTIDKWRDKARQILEKTYLYLLKDFTNDTAQIISSLNILAMSKVAENIEMHPTLKDSIINTLSQHQLIDKKDIPFLIRLKTNKNIPSLLWK